MKFTSLAAMLLMGLVFVACGGTSANEAAGETQRPKPSHGGTNACSTDAADGDEKQAEAETVDSSPLAVWIRVDGMTKVQGIT